MPSIFLIEMIASKDNLKNNTSKSIERHAEITHSIKKAPSKRGLKKH